MTDKYFIIRTESNDAVAPQPWSIVVHETGDIVSGRPDADYFANYAKEGAAPVFSNKGEMFTLNQVIVSCHPYLDNLTDTDLTAAIGKLRELEARYKAAIGAQDEPPKPVTKRVTMERHINTRRHSTFTADVPISMLSDERYFDTDEYPTPAFDQWMCDNGHEADVTFDQGDDGGDLYYEVTEVGA